MKKQHKNSILEDFQSNRFILMITSVKSLKQYQCYCARLSSDTKNKVNDGDEEVKFFSKVWKYYLRKLAIKYC
jgi:hypothetical protein